MSRVSTRNAPHYTIEDDATTLLTVIVGGWALLTISMFAPASYGLGLMFALGTITSLVGVLVVPTGVVGLTYRLLVDSRRVVSEQRQLTAREKPT